MCVCVCVCVCRWLYSTSYNYIIFQGTLYVRTFQRVIELQEKENFPCYVLHCFRSFVNNFML